MSMRIDQAVKILEIYKSKNVVVVTFIKKDGTRRIMKSTLNFTIIPKDSRPKKLDLQNILTTMKKGILRVFDLEKMEWRSVPMDRIESIE